MGARRPILVNFVLDETGSMFTVKSETIVGFNSYVDSLRGKKQKTSLTLTQFNSSGVRIVYKNKDVNEVPSLTDKSYNPASFTNLYDAIGKTISDVERELAQQTEKPRVLFVIMTDGQENASREYTHNMIFDLIDKKKKDGWTFAFLGSEADTWSVAKNMGIPVGNTVKYDPSNVKAMFYTAAAGTQSYAVADSLTAQDNLFADVEPIQFDPDNLTSMTPMPSRFNYTAPGRVTWTTDDGNNWSHSVSGTTDATLGIGLVHSGWSSPSRAVATDWGNADDQRFSTTPLSVYNTEVERDVVLVNPEEGHASATITVDWGDFDPIIRDFIDQVATPRTVDALEQRVANKIAEALSKATLSRIKRGGKKTR